MMSEPEKQAATSRPRPGSGCARLVRRLRQPAIPCLPVVRPQQVLAGGRTPTCLQRALSMPARLPYSLSRLCGWTEKAPYRPRLVAGPLLGTCLDDLVRFERVAGKEDARPGTQRAPLPPAPESLRPASLTSAEKATSAHRLERPQAWAAQAASLLRLADSPSRDLPFAQPAQAPLELLTRSAGGMHTLAALAKGAGASRLSGHAVVPTRAAARLGVAQPAYLLSEWVNRLSRRLIQQLETGDATSRLSPQDWIERSMALPVAGPQASRDLLIRLVDISVPGAGDSTRPSRTGEKAPPALLRSPGERSPSGLPAWEAPFSRAPRQAAPAPTTLIPPGAQQGFYPQAGVLPLPGAGQPNYRPPFAPPLAASTPPTLMTPQDVYDAPTPYAAAALRQEAKKDEELLVQEDLDMLAGKIKRILDEEAQRFGIPT